MSGGGSGQRLVGRARPLAELEAALREAVAGRGALALVTGEAGIGKSRLAAELAARAPALGARVVWASCWDGGGAPAYWPWVQALRAAGPATGPAPAGAGHAIHVLELVGTPGDGGADEVLDRRARDAYRARAEELRDEIEQARQDHDPERAARARVELEAIADELTAAMGLGGRARRLGDPAERARKNVSWRLRSTLDRIEQAHPDLGRHLRPSVRMGTLCSYEPDPPVRWDVG